MKIVKQLARLGGGSHCRIRQRIRRGQKIRIRVRVVFNRG